MLCAMAQPSLNKR